MNDDTLAEEQTSGNAYSDFWFYDVNGNYLSKTTKGANTQGRFTYWNQNGGTPGTHTATLHIKGYTDDAKLFYSHILGDTDNLHLGGPTIFEGLMLVANRYCDSRVRTMGYNVTYKTLILHTRMPATIRVATPFLRLSTDITVLL